MSWITVAWSVNAGICLALAGVHLLAWARARDLWAHLAFALCALSVASIASFELAVMRVGTPTDYEILLRWAHVPIATLVISLIVFIRLYLGAGRVWLLLSIVVVRALGLVMNFATDANVTFKEITALRYVTVWGERLAVPVGVPSDWNWLIRLGDVLLLLFIADAAIGAWRAGRRRQAVVMGVALICTILGAAASSLMLTRGHLPGPATVTLPFMILMFTMGHELGVELVRTHQLARELQQNQKRMHLATEAANLGLWEWDRRRGDIWVSPEGRALFGLDPFEPVSIARFYHAVHSADRERVQVELEAALARVGDFVVEHRIERHDGVRWITTRGRVDVADDGGAGRMRGISMDVTQARQTEMELRRHRAELAHVSRVASVGQLTTALAHELNQPLTAILSNAEAAQRHLAHGTADTTVLQEILHDIAEDDVRAGEIIRRIRGLVRKDEPERRPVDIAAAIREVVELVRNDASLQHVTVVSAIDPSCPSVFGDRVQLQQVLLNLMLNALDAMRAVSEGNREILVTAARDGQLARVVVRDRGTGIDAEKVEDIFLPFVTTKPDGLGVGLSICRTIIQDHGGRLWAENNPDGGATFQFTLPCFEGAPAPGSAAKPDTMSEAPLVS